MDSAFFEKQRPMDSPFLYFRHDFVERTDVVLARGKNFLQTLLPFGHGLGLKDKNICHLAVRQMEPLKHTHAHVLLVEGGIGRTKARHEIFVIFVKRNCQPFPFRVGEPDKTLG